MTQTRASFNKSHPETAEGEVFLTNIPLNNDGMLYWDCESFDNDRRSSWERIGWRSKRMGSVAYDIYGKRLSGMIPVFVQRTELKKSGVNPDKL